MKKILLTGALFVMVFAITTKAKAQTDSTATSNVAVSIETVTELNVTGNATASFAFTTGAELIGGKEQLKAVTLNSKSNKLTNITIKALTDHFSSSTAGNAHMPVSVIEWKNNNGGTYTNLSTSPATVVTSQAKGTSNVEIDYQIKPTLAYDPATDYSVTIEYTLTTQ